jgi:cell division protein FtsX
MSVEPRPRRAGSRLYPAVVAVVVVITGALVAVWYRHNHAAPPPHAGAGYQVTVFLSTNASDADKHAIEAALRDLRPVDGIRFENRQEAWQRFKEEFKDAPDLVQATRPENLPESYRLKVAELHPVCPALQRIRQLPGVDDVVTASLAERTPSFEPHPQERASNSPTC